MNKMTTQLYAARNKMAGVICGLSASTMMMVAAHADDPWGGLFGTLQNVFTPLQSHLQAIAIPVALAMSLFCLVMMLTTQNQKKVETYRSWLITIIVCVVVIFAMPYIINVAKTIGESINAS